MTDQEHQAECLEIHNAAVAIRRMSQPMQVHVYETLARDKGQEYANRVRAANGLTRKLLDQHGMTYSQIRSDK